MAMLLHSILVSRVKDWRPGTLIPLLIPALIPAVLIASLLIITGAHANSGNPVRLMVLGDSLAAGYGLEKNDSFTEQLATALGKQGHAIHMINAGVSGDTSAGGKARVGWALADKPDAIILELGANDGLRGLDPAETHANLDAILTRLKSAKIRVLLAGMLAPPNRGKDYGAEFARIYPVLAEQHNVPLYKFFLEGVAANANLNQKDGIHPNAAGVAEIVRRILPAVEELIGSVKK